MSCGLYHDRVFFGPGTINNSYILACLEGITLVGGSRKQPVIDRDSFVTFTIACEQGHVGAQAHAPRDREEKVPLHQTPDPSRRIALLHRLRALLEGEQLEGYIYHGNEEIVYFAVLLLFLFLLSYIMQSVFKSPMS